MKPPATPASDIGEELFLHSLKPEHIVVLVPEHTNTAITAWVTHIGRDCALFHAGLIRTTLGLLADKQGAFFDDQHRRIHVHRYQGAI